MCFRAFPDGAPPFISHQCPIWQNALPSPALLLAGAKFCVENFSGKLPQTAKELRTIPGIGPYTAAAVSSIAYGQAEAAVDGARGGRALARSKSTWQRRTIPSADPFSKTLPELG